MQTARASMLGRRRFTWPLVRPPFPAPLHVDCCCVRVHVLRRGTGPEFSSAGWARAEAVQVLLQHGADPNKSDRFGKNAFDAALAAGESRAQMERLLRQHSSSS